mmetsp:Transcript_238/g.247  ORF Transcript_238/g.247 Transcript_238/m.247 type:complete len:260 (-) Transcript_238:396-1175(-)
MTRHTKQRCITSQVYGTIALFLAAASPAHSFTSPTENRISVHNPASQSQRNSNKQTSSLTTTTLFGYQDYYGRSSPRTGMDGDRSKRQERVGHLVRVNVAEIISRGTEIKNNEFIEDETRALISVVNADVSPDLRQARLTVSILGEDVMAKRVGFNWLMKSERAIKHALAQRLSHMKGIPDLTFVQADVGAAVDVMDLIERISAERLKRENVGVYGGDEDGLPKGVVEGFDFDEEFEDEDWDEEDDEDWDEEGDDDDEE